MSQKDEEEDQQTHNQLIKYHLLTRKLNNPNKKHTNMTPIGTIANQKPAGTRKTRHMLQNLARKENKTVILEQEICTDQLYKRGWKWPRLPNGTVEGVNLPELRRILIDMTGINYFLKNVLFIFLYHITHSTTTSNLIKIVQTLLKWNITLNQVDGAHRLSAI